MLLFLCYLCAVASVVGRLYDVHEYGIVAGPLLDPSASVVQVPGEGYRMYYTNWTDLLMATSPDKITWTAWPANPVAAMPEGNVGRLVVEHYAGAFLGANTGLNATTRFMHYRLWLPFYPDPESLHAQWYYAESPDGIIWYNWDTLTLFGPVEPFPVEYEDWCGVSEPAVEVLYVPGASNTGVDWSFRGYYGQRVLVHPNGTVCQSGCETSLCNDTHMHFRALLAFSANGRNWTGYSLDNLTTAVVMEGRGTGGPDVSGVMYFSPIRRGANTWEAVYTEADIDLVEGMPSTWSASISHANSTDGLVWSADQVLVATNNTTLLFYMLSVLRTACNTLDVWYVPYAESSSVWFLTLVKPCPFSRADVISVTIAACIVGAAGVAGIVMAVRSHLASHTHVY
jgi:hypothetical protein